jgi:hypothetical protein
MCFLVVVKQDKWMKSAHFAQQYEFGGARWFEEALCVIAVLAGSRQLHEYDLLRPRSG